MTKEETWSAFVIEWERRLAESGVVILVALVLAC